MDIYQKPKSTKDIIFLLDSFFVKNYNSKTAEEINLPMGAATFHKATLDYVANNKTSEVYAFKQLCYRPFDESKSNKKIRNNYYYQYQVLINGSYCGIKIVQQALKAIGLESEATILEDNWTAPTMSALGKGWEFRVLGLEVTQITYFEKFGIFNSEFNVLEIVFGLERLDMLINQRSSIVTDGYEEFPLVRKYKKLNLEEVFKIFLDYLSSEYVNYEKFLEINTIFNILDGDSYFSESEKNFYMILISKLFNNYLRNEYKNIL